MPIVYGRRARLAAAALLTVPLGLLTRADLPMPAMVALYGGDTLYATLAYFLIALLLPRRRPPLVAAIALACCYAVEAAQLIQAPWLVALRETAPGRLVLGAGFLWSDLLCYAAGVALGLLVDRALLR